MEYRRCGKTNMMVSAVCLGGHWKRVDKVLPEKAGGQGWLGLGAGDPDFDKNRRDVVSRCIDRGINYIDACWSNEVIAYSKALRRTPRQDVPGLFLGRHRSPLSRMADLRETEARFRGRAEDGRPGVRRPVAHHLPGTEQPARRRRRSRS